MIIEDVIFKLDSILFYPVYFFFIRIENRLMAFRGLRLKKLTKKTTLLKAIQNLSICGDPPPGRAGTDRASEKKYPICDLGETFVAFALKKDYQKKE